jgi:multiple sugar transport system permease protein
MTSNRAIRRHAVNVAVALVAIAMLGFVLFPIYFLVTSSLRSPQDLFATPPTLIPIPPSMHFYKVATNEAPLALWTRNSFLVVAGTVALTLPLAALAAYSIARLTFRGRTAAGRMMLLLYLFPSVLLLVPLFVLLAQLRLVNTLPALIVAHATFALPFSVWYLSAYFRGIPRDLDDAGLVDGCNRVNLLWHVLLPVAAPGIAATVAFVFMFSWNEYAFAVTMIQNAELRTLPLGVTSYFSAQGISWGVVLATSVLMSIPVVVAVQLAQRYFVAGLAAGSVKQ